MGTIELKLDLPEFKDELSVNIIIKRDGEVIYNDTSSPQSNKEASTPVKKTISKAKKSSISGGNMMDAEF